MNITVSSNSHEGGFGLLSPQLQHQNYIHVTDEKGGKRFDRVHLFWIKLGLAMPVSVQSFYFILNFYIEVLHYVCADFKCKLMNRNQYMICKCVLFQAYKISAKTGRHRIFGFLDT